MGDMKRASFHSVRPGTLVLLAALAFWGLPAAIAQGGGSDQCIGHDDCLSASFCAVETCESSQGLKWLCGKCRSCLECRCNSMAVGDRCPDHCWTISAAMNVSVLETTVDGFFKATPNSNDPCVDMWEFRAPFFSVFRFPAALLLEPEVLGDAQASKSRRQTDMYDVHSAACLSPSSH